MSRKVGVLLSDPTLKIRSGPMHFGKDWPGTYIEGLKSLEYAHALSKIGSLIDEERIAEHAQIVTTLDELRYLLDQCRVRSGEWCEMSAAPTTANRDDSNG